MTLDEELAAIEKRANAATPGPWGYYQPSCCPDMGGVAGPTGTKCLKAVVGERYDHPATIEDAEFIAASRTDVPRLVAALRLAIEQRDNEAENLDLERHDWLGPNHEKRVSEYNAAILHVLRGEK